MDDAQRSILERLIALGTAHDLLVQDRWISADIRDVVRSAMKVYAGDSARMSATGGGLQLSSRSALTISMILNELATNAVKYGSLSTPAGMVDLSWMVEKQSNELNFRWSELGGPLVTPPSRRGFGTRLLTQALPADLGGSATLRYEPTGLVFELRAPVASLSVVASTKEEAN
jgi:two-component sensor histidine kinase